MAAPAMDPAALDPAAPGPPRPVASYRTDLVTTVLGAWFKASGKRDRVVLATKVGWETATGKLTAAHIERVNFDSVITADFQDLRREIVVELIAFAQTREYVKRVSAIYARYRFLYGPTPFELPLTLDLHYRADGPDY